jgi:nucleoside-diphosphate-sugar epimerase
MRVFLAGATGDVGRPLTRALVAAGHQVTGMTHRPDRRAMLESLGATPAMADALDGPAVRRAVADSRPEAVIDVLTALPRSGPLRSSHLRATNRIRARGSPILIDAARRAGARRLVSESIVYAYGYGDLGPEPITEQHPLYPPGGGIPSAIEAMRIKEQGTLTAEGLEGIVLRYGAFYGPDVGSTRFMIRAARRRMLALPGGGRGVVSWVHVEDAAAATVAALERGRSGEAYNVVDDVPASFREFADELTRVLGLPRPWSVPAWAARPFASYAADFMARTRVRASNRKAREELGWGPAFPTYREGLAQVAAEIRGRTTGRSAPS